MARFLGATCGRGGRSHRCRLLRRARPPPCGRPSRPPWPRRLLCGASTASSGRGAPRLQRAAAARRWCTLGSLWLDQATACSATSSCARAGAARAAAARQRRAAARTGRPGAARPGVGPVHAGPLRGPAAPRGRPVHARAPRVRAGADRTRPAGDAVRAAASRPRCACARSHGPAAARRHAGDGRVVPLRRQPLRRAAVGRRPGHRAFAHGRPARQCATQIVLLDGRNWASRWRWAWPASRTRRTRRTSWWRLRGGAGRGARRGGNHVTLASIRSRRRPDQPRCDLPGHVEQAARPNSSSAKTRLSRGVGAVRHARAQRRHGHAGPRR
jgi:hypothetical protein